MIEAQKKRVVSRPGRPFTGRGDPRNGRSPGRPPAPRCIADLLRWAGALQAPEKLCEEMRRVFGIPADQPLTVDQATILRVRVDALRGESRAVEFWADRTEGRAPETLHREGGAVMEIVEEIVEAKPKATS